MNRYYFAKGVKSPVLEHWGHFFRLSSDRQGPHCIRYNSTSAPSNSCMLTWVKGGSSKFHVHTQVIHNRPHSWPSHMDQRWSPGPSQHLGKQAVSLCWEQNCWTTVSRWHSSTNAFTFSVTPLCTQVFFFFFLAVPLGFFPFLDLSLPYPFLLRAVP